jgi:putative heme iron utilization protein
VSETSLADRARVLVARCRVGTLSTHSQKLTGFPFGSLMPFAVDTLGRPTFFVSNLAMHTRNLQHDPRASLLVAPPEVSGDPLSAARVTLVGTAVAAPAAEVRDVYLSCHENAGSWQDFGDFAYYRLDVSAAYFIGGFGVMGWISGADYRAALPDPPPAT